MTKAILLAVAVAGALSSFASQRPDTVHLRPATARPRPAPQKQPPAAVAEDFYESGGTRVIDSDQYGGVWVTVIPVSNARTKGALVIVNFLRDEADEISRTMQTY